MCCKEGESEGKDTALYGPSHANIHFDLKIIIFFSLFPLSRWGLKYEVWCINRLGAEKKVRNSFFLSDHSFMVDKPARLSFSCSLDLLLNDIDQTNMNRDIRDGNWLSISWEYIPNKFLLATFNWKIKNIRR